MKTVRDIYNALFAFAPASMKMDWDNVGLLCGSRKKEVEQVLVALDITERVVQEAIDLGAQLIVSHHPVMNVRWHEREMQTLRSDTRLGGLLTTLVKNDISAICMHTNLDAADGGVNDCLAKKLGLNDVFLLNDEKIGRIGTLSCEKGLEEFLRDVIESLSCSGLRYRRGSGRVHRVAVGGGACGEYIPQAIAQGCDTFVTSDLRYNDFLDTRGLNLIDAGHFPTENVVCPAIKAYLEEHLPGLYTRLILSGKLYEHLAETDQVCRDRMERMIPRMAEVEGINEQLKASDQLGWVSRMNSIHQRAEKIILDELVFA